ncbi:protein of unknown function [Methylacidimicrobium sp. AP8]|nr:protein of unknown function [Methylacidimicrobium sp. AP8]
MAEENLRPASQPKPICGASATKFANISRQPDRGPRRKIGRFSAPLRACHCPELLSLSFSLSP